MNPERSLNELRTIAAEMLAYSVGKLFPNVLFFGGGVTKHGFYYDFIFEQALYTEMLTLIDVNNRTCVKEDVEIRPINMMRENAIALFNHRGQPFLAEKAADEELNVINLVQINNDFYGLCSAPTTTSGEIGAVKLLDMSEKLVMTSEGEVAVTRLTGTAFSNPMALKKFVKAYEAMLKKKDHRTLGVELDLFSFDPEIGTIQPIWHPKGTLLKQILKDWLKTQGKNLPIQQVESPAVVKSDLYRKPGLIEFPFENDSYCLAPSFLPHHLYLLNRTKFYGDPLRFLEYGTHFQEVAESQSWGLFSTHSYQTDLMTVRCLNEQVLEEVISSLQFIEQSIRIFGFEAHWYLIASKQRTPKAKLEKEAVERLVKAAEGHSFHFPLIPGIQEEENLLGPRFELRLLDEIGREWPGATLTLVTQNTVNDSVLARSVWGSLDRFVALLIERFEGEFPLWLAPEQIRILSVGQIDSYAATVYESCAKRGFRVGLDLRDEKLGLKIHAAEKEKIPFVIIVGDQEIKKQCVTVRSIKRPGKSDTVKLDQFLDQIQEELGLRD